MLDDRMPGEHPNRGWNRASITFWSRRPYRPRLRPEDRRIPTNLGPVRVLVVSAATAACVTAVLLWPPLFYASLFVHMSGSVFGGVLAGAALALTLVFCGLVARETRRNRDPASTQSPGAARSPKTSAAARTSSG